MALVAVVERREIIIPHRRDLLDELRFDDAEVLRSGRIRYGAPEGGRVHDDLVTALALAIRGARGGAEPQSLAEAGFVPFLTTSSPSPA